MLWQDHRYPTGDAGHDNNIMMAPLRNPLGK
jgi:hypothetical protein